MAELCLQAKITRKTFYLHFENIPSYFQQFIEQLLIELEESILSSTRDRETADHQLEPKMIYLFEHVYANRVFYHFIFDNTSHFAYYEMFFTRIKKLVKQSAETYPHEPMLNDFEVSYQVNAILGIIMEWYYQGFSQSIEEMNELFFCALKCRL